ncbi:MAG: hydroxyacylglutathione hydrolase C-terminal domain-containing protein [Parvularculaceae bacterium]
MSATRFSALGCGRLFEGTPDQMWSSLSKIAAMPPETKLYCAHEYTQSNAKFALSVDPHNDDLKQRAKDIAAARAKNMPTVPTTVALELATNPFLRARDAGLQANLGHDQPAHRFGRVFAETRKRKDNFR